MNDVIVIAGVFAFWVIAQIVVIAVFWPRRKDRPCLDFQGFLDQRLQDKREAKGS